MKKMYVLLTLTILITSNVYAACELNKGFEKFNTDKFKGEPVTPTDPIKGLKVITPKEALTMIKDDKYVFIDTRPESFFKKCQIRKSKPHAYAIPKHKGNILTQEIVKKLADSKKTLVFYCNALKCYRGLNAAIQTCNWGVPVAQIKWLAKGVPGVVKAAGKKMKKFVKGKGCVQFTAK